METGITTGHLYTAYHVRAVHRYARQPHVERVVTATGFVLRSQSSRLFFVTNRHVLDLPWSSSQFDGFAPAKVDVRTHNPAPTGPPVMGLSMAPRIESISSHSDDTIDIAGFEVDTTISCEDPNPTIYNWIGEEYLATKQDFAEGIDAGELLYFPGYPEWYDHNGNRPIMRTGALVSDPQSEYRRTDGPPSRLDGNSQFLFDAFSTSGNSGSPIFVGNRGFNAGEGLTHSGTYRSAKLIGINAGHIKDQTSNHTGLSRAYKSVSILEFLRALEGS